MGRGTGCETAASAYRWPGGRRPRRYRPTFSLPPLPTELTDADILDRAHALQDLERLPLEQIEKIGRIDAPAEVRLLATSALHRNKMTGLVRRAHVGVVEREGELLFASLIIQRTPEGSSTIHYYTEGRDLAAIASTLGADIMYGCRAGERRLVFRAVDNPDGPYRLDPPVVHERFRSLWRDAERRP